MPWQSTADSAAHKSRPSLFFFTNCSSSLAKQRSNDKPGMGPKASAANVPSKELSWIDRMYLKLENMCVEVDKNPSILLQETSKYMESHMNVVGANVKKLCTELIQDLISQPLLTPEGAGKPTECAIHCKCHCMDAEKPKRKSVDMVSKGSNPKTGQGLAPAKGFESGDKRNESVTFQMKDISKGGDMKFETRPEEFAMQGQDLNIEGSIQKSEVSGKELNNISAMDYGEKLTTAGGQEVLKTLIEADETGTDREVEEHLSLLKRSFEEGQDDSAKASNKYSKDDENGIMDKERSINFVPCRGELDLAEQASRPEENDCREFNTVDGQMMMHIDIELPSNVMASDLRVEEVKVEQQAVDVLCETHANRLKSISKFCMDWHASHAKAQKSFNSKIVACMKMDASDGKIMEEEEFKEGGGDLWSMYSYVFSELSKPNEEEDPTIMLDSVIGEDFEDEEQSAHWFDGEDLKKALHTENFCIEKPQQTEGRVKEYDSDWELV